jgi:hypothetical protein
LKIKKHDSFRQTDGSQGKNLISTVEGVHKDGSAVPLDISIAKFDLDGVEYFTCIARDVSTRIQREDALKFRPETEQRQLSIQSRLDNHHTIVVRIKDKGPGIEQADQEKILTPFFTSKATGMGMGLSICQSIVRAHNGELSFNSQPGKGTTFYFTLPLQDKENGT